MPCPSSCLVFCCSAAPLLPFLLPADLQSNNLPSFTGFTSGLAIFVCSILRKVEENCLFQSSYLLIFQLSQVKLNGGVCCLPAKNPSPWVTVWSHLQFTQLSPVFHKNTQSLWWVGVLKLPRHHLIVCNAILWDSIKVLDIFPIMQESANTLTSLNGQSWRA